MRQHYLPEFEFENPHFPVGLCINHRKLLGEVGKGTKSASDLPEPYNFAELTIPTSTRQKLYACELCQVARGSLGRPAVVAQKKSDSPSSVDDDVVGKNSAELMGNDYNSHDYNNYEMSDQDNDEVNHHLNQLERQ